MTALIVFIMFMSFFGMIWLSTKAADYHYRTYEGDAPLYIYYAVLFISVYAAIFFQLIESFNLAN